MAYERYVPEFTDKNGQVYGVMDAEARDNIANLNSAINDIETRVDEISYGIKNQAYPTQEKMGTTDYGSVSVSDGVIYATASGYGSIECVVRYIDDFDTEVNDKIYIYCNAEVSKANCQRIRITYCGVDNDQATPIAETTYSMSKIVTCTNVTYKNRIVFRFHFPTTSEAAGAVLTISNLIFVNLTKFYGAGNEPTKAEMDEIVASAGGYFNFMNLFDPKDVVERIDTLSSNAEKINGLTESKVTNLFTSRPGYSNNNNEYNKVYGSASTDRSAYFSTGVTAGHLVFTAARVKVKGRSCNYIRTSVGDFAIRMLAENPTLETEYVVSGIGCVGDSGNAAIAANFTESDASNELYWKNWLVLDLTALFGEGAEPQLEVMTLLYRSLELSDWNATEPNLFHASVSFVASVFKLLYPRGNYVCVESDGSNTIHSVPNSTWSHWTDVNPDGQETYQFGQERWATNIPVYNKVHGTIETDGMLSVIPEYGRFTDGASNQPYAYGGHTLEMWNKLRTWRATMVMGHYDVDEVAFQVYHPGVGQYGFVRLGNDMANRGVVFGGNYTKAYNPIEFVDQSYGPILTSPNGTKYKINVANDGTLSTSEYTSSPEFPDDRTTH